MNNNDSPVVAPDNKPVVSEPTENKMAAFLFDEPNPVIEEAVGGGATPVTPVVDPIKDLAAQAQAAQNQVEPPTKITPGQEAQILAQQQQQQAPVAPVVPIAPPVQQSAPIIEPVVQPMVQPPVQQQQQQVAPQLTQEQVAQQLNIYSLTEADYDAVFDTNDKQESIKALDNILQKAVRQAVTMSHVLVQEAQHKIQTQVQPYMQFADEQKHSALEQAFFTEHKDLEAARPVVDAVLKQFQQSGQKFASPKQLFDAVAQNTKAYLLQIQQLGQTVAPAVQGLNQQQQQTTVQTTGRSRMAVLPSGGQSGAGTGGGNSGKTNTAQTLFG